MSYTLEVAQDRRTREQFRSSNPVLLSGQLAIETDTGVCTAGDGSTAYLTLRGNVSLSERERRSADDVHAARSLDSSPVVGEPVEWVGTLTQTGTNNPTAVVLENGLGGDVVWERLAEGVYSGTLVGAFPAGRVVVTINIGQATLAYEARILRASDDAVAIYTFDTGVAVDDRLTAAMVVLRVYPE